MKGYVDRSEKLRNEASIFRAFWAALSHTDPISGLRHQKWIHSGDNDAPDFLCKHAKVGIELAEWLDRRQTKIARERDRLEAELKNFIPGNACRTFNRAVSRESLWF